MHISEASFCSNIQSFEPHKHSLQSLSWKLVSDLSLISSVFFQALALWYVFKKRLQQLQVLWPTSAAVTFAFIFCSISEAIKEYPELVRKYLGSVVPASDNFYATLNSAVFSDGSFVYIPPGVKCPMELSTYFRINAENTGQFERTLIIADKGSYVSYLDVCTDPNRNTIQLHAAVVEIVV